jgi:hypothetical protein
LEYRFIKLLIFLHEFLVELPNSTEVRLRSNRHAKLYDTRMIPRQYCLQILAVRR